MSKADWDHFRYIAFKLEGTPVSRRAADNGLRGKARSDGIPDDKMPQLTRYEWPYGIVKIDHMFDRTLRTSINNWTFVVQGGEKQSVTAVTLSASGTIKTLTTRLQILQERKRPEHANAKGSSKGATKPRARSPTGQSGARTAGIAPAPKGPIKP